jgi:O-antigen/teichoic acid export membrane protein
MRQRNIGVIALFAVAIGIFCNIVGNLTTQAVTRSVKNCERVKRQDVVWVSVSIQASIALGVLLVAIGIAGFYQTDAV